MNTLNRHSFGSLGRNPNWELTCGFPLCRHLTPGTNRDGGWCTHRDNRVSPRDGWPDGFMPSVASTGGCDLHTSNSSIKLPAEQMELQDVSSNTSREANGCQ
jgi:hypothetical protein